jgi:acyl-CoA thioesterase I
VSGFRITLFLLIGAAVAAAQQAEVTDDRPVILALGDSLTAGFGVPRGFGYPEQLQQKLDANGYRYRVVNMGLSGDTTAGGRARMNRALATKAMIVILELGGNDASNGIRLTQTQANLDQMIAFFKSGGSTVVLAGRPVSPSQNVHKILAEKHGLRWIPNFLEGVAGHQDLTIGDGVHPNADGYAIVTDTVFTTIQPLLKK